MKITERKGWNKVWSKNISTYDRDLGEIKLRLEHDNFRRPFYFLCGIVSSKDGEYLSKIETESSEGRWIFDTIYPYLILDYEELFLDPLPRKRKVSLESQFKIFQLLKEGFYAPMRDNIITLDEIDQIHYRNNITSLWTEIL